MSVGERARIKCSDLDFQLVKFVNETGERDNGRELKREREWNEGNVHGKNVVRMFEVINNNWFHVPVIKLKQQNSFQLTSKERERETGERGHEKSMTRREREKMQARASKFPG